MKLIPLTKNKTAKIDEIDFERVSRWKWSYCPNRGGYAVRNVTYAPGKHRSLSMARFVMSAPEGKFVDHINGDSLDNRRSNLRLVTHAQNQMNQKRRSDNTSGYKGVQWSRQKQKWIAVAQKAGDLYFGGAFTNKVEAAKAYDRLASSLFGEYARLNFPERTTRDLRSPYTVELDQAA